MKKAHLIETGEAGRKPPKLAPPVFTEQALARADKTLEAMADTFEKWLDADLAKLQAVRRHAAAAGWDNDALDGLWRAAHDLKGMGATYGYPLVTQLAALLCCLLETETGRAAARAHPVLVTAHVDGLRAAVRERITTDAHPVGRELLYRLEDQLRRLGVGSA